MRRVDDVIGEYDVTKKSGRKKAQIIEWFQKQPGMRFDVGEVYAALGDELDIGEGQVRNYLNDLANEDVLQRHGEKRIAYQLADDIIVPARYQVQTALKHIGSLFDIKRWGIAGFLTIMTVVWATLTFPFWFLWGTLVISPTNSYASITRPEFLRMAVSMTLWLIVFIFANTILNRLRRWYQGKQSA